MKFIPRIFMAGRKLNAAALIGVGLFALTSTATLFAQLQVKTAFPPAFESKLWKELLPWGRNTGPAGEIIWATPADLNNVPSTNRVALGSVDEFGNIIYRSGLPGDDITWPYALNESESLPKFQLQFDALDPGQCTFSHAADYDIDSSIYWPQIRQCKGPNGEMLPPPPGRLLNPVAMAVNGTKVYVSDLFNHRVQVFDFYGNAIPIQFPIGNGVPAGGYYDVEAENPGLTYRPYGEGFSGGYRGHQLNSPYGIAVDARTVSGSPAGRLLVADGGNNRVAIFNPDGSAAFGTEAEPIHAEFELPVDSSGDPLDQGLEPVRPDLVAISPGAVVLAPGTELLPGDPAENDRIVVTDRWHCYVLIMDTAFNLVKSLPEANPESPQHHSCHDPETTLPSGEIVPTQEGEFSTVTGVKIDRNGNIYVADHAQNVVQVFDRDGNFVTWIGKPGGDNPGDVEGQLQGPVGLLLDQFGGVNGDQFQRLGVIDEGNGRAVFYDIKNGPANAAFEFQLDITVGVDDFPMGIELQRGPASQGLDPKGRILVTDPWRRRVLRFELPELVIINAAAEIVDPSQSPKLGAGSFDVAVPLQKAGPVQGVTVTIDGIEAGVTEGAHTPSSPVDIAPGEFQHYDFDFTLSSGSRATFRIDASGDNGLSTAPRATASATLVCTNCLADHAVYNHPETDPPVPAELHLTAPSNNGTWYGQEVLVRITPTGSVPADRIGWYFEGAAADFYDPLIHEVAVTNGHVDVLVGWPGMSTLTYWPISDALGEGLPVTVPLNVDLDAPDVDFLSWSPPVAVQGADYWYRTDPTGVTAPVEVIGTYKVTDDFSGVEIPTSDLNPGTVTFTSEGRDQVRTITVKDYAEHSATYNSFDVTLGRRINIDNTAPVFDPSPATVPLTITGTDQDGPYAIPAAGAITVRATDPPLGLSPGSGPNEFNLANPGGQTFRNGDTITFTATDVAGNTTQKVVTISLAQATPTLLYVGDPSVTYGGTLTMTAEVGPPSATGDVTFTVFGRDPVTGPLQNIEVAPGVFKRRATATLDHVLSNVGNYTVQMDYSGDAVLAPVSATGTVEVKPFTVVVTAVPKSKLSGVPDPPLEFTSVPAEADLFNETDAFEGQIGRVNPEGNALGAFAIEKYALRLNNPNYYLEFHGAFFTVYGRVVVSAIEQTIDYGETPDFDPVFGPFPAGSSMANVTDQPVCTVDGPYSGGAGEYTVVCSGAAGEILGEGGLPLRTEDGSSLLTFEYSPATLSIKKVRPVATIAGGGQFSYDGLPHAATCTVVGVNGQTFQSPISYSPGLNEPPVNVSTITATCDFAENENYLSASDTDEIEIVKAVPAVALTGGPFTYDGTTHSATCSITGVGNQTLAHTLSYSPGPDGPRNVTTTDSATCALAGDGNYESASMTRTLVVNPRQITITADPKTKSYGEVDPALTYKITDGSLVPGDPLTGTLDRVQGEDAGASYPIIQGTLTAGTNYFITYVGANLTIRALNQLPLAFDDAISSIGAAPVTIDVLANDSDPDGGTMSVTAVTQPAGGEGVVTLTGNFVVFRPTPGFAGTATFTYVVSDGQGSATATVRVTIVAASCTISGYTTYSQGGWGSKPKGNNPGQLLASNFASVYPGGFVIIGGTKTLTFTSASAIAAFLPQGGTPKVLTSSAVNPTSSSAGNFAAQLLALRLSVDFSAAGVTKAGLGELVMLSGPFTGFTVNQILAVANAVIGGQTSALPSGMSVSTLSGILESLNLNFHEGTVNRGLLGCPEGPQPPTVTVSNQTNYEGEAPSVRIVGIDPNGDDLTYSATGLPPGLSINPATGKITGTLGYSAAGTYTVSLTVVDESGLSATATFVWKVVDKNRPPVAVANNLSTLKNTAKTISVIANDSDPDGDTLSLTAVTQPARGSVVKDSNGTVKYTPPPNWIGTTTFTYTISDGKGGTRTATVSVTVTSHNDNDDCDRDHDHDGDRDHDDHRESDCDRDHRHNSNCDRHS